MATTNNTKPIVVPVEKVREYYHIERALFGFLSYEVTDRIETVQKLLLIEIEEIPPKVFLNDVEYVTKQN